MTCYESAKQKLILNELFEKLNFHQKKKNILNRTSAILSPVSLDLALEDKITKNRLKNINKQDCCPSQKKL